MFTIETIDAIIIALWIIAAAFDYADFLYVWQLKDYRWAKILDFAKSTEGVSYWFSYPTFVRPFFGLITFFLLFTVQRPIIPYLVVGFLVGDILYQIYRWRIKRRIRRPRLTARILLSLLLCYVVEAAALLQGGRWVYILFLASVRLYTTSVAVTIVALPFLIIKRIVVLLATKKMAALSSMTKVGITGSYGKTTVKEFLSHILASTHTVVKTPKHVNTDIGVALFILKTNFKDVDVFVAEMGADHKGDIRKLAAIVQPNIGILTAINEQHVALFGSIQKIQKEKYELLRAIPKDGLVIANSDISYCREFLHELAAEVQTFGIDDEFHPTAHLKDIDESPKGIDIVGVVDGEERRIFAPLHGVHNAVNLGPCALVAKRLGVPLDVYKKQVASLTQPSRSLELFQYGKALIIDDSYNANPTGFHAALDYMHSFPSEKRRIVVTRGMLELGQYSSVLHEKVAGAIAFIADELILISPNEEKAMKKGLVSDKYKTVFTLETNPKELLRRLQALREEECVILLENRLPQDVYDQVLGETEPVIW